MEELKIRSLLVDDESNSMVTLSKMIELYCPSLEIIGTALTANEAISKINNLNPDLVFLDISLPDGDGFHVLEHVDYKDFEVIFCTALNTYAIRAFEFSALHYLLKPIDPEELKKAIARFSTRHYSQMFTEQLGVLKEVINKRLNKIMISSNEGFELIEVAQIIRCESSGGYTIIYLMNGKKLVSSKTLNTYEQLLCDSQFFRVHNSHLVNLNHVLRYEKGRGGIVCMTDGSKVDVAENRKTSFMDRISSLFKF
jgi:two-component system LytT family response regulator